jgi:hypothetical protein
MDCWFEVPYLQDIVHQLRRLMESLTTFHIGHNSCIILAQAFHIECV